MVDTEAGRAKHYADQFTFDHGDLTPPFSPARYSEAITAADAAGYPVIVVDSCSHEHSGDGGLLDMQEAEFQRMGGKDSAKMASWVKPKGEHRKFAGKLLQVRAHLILCFRASEKIEMVRVDGKMEVRKKQTATGLDGWVPECEKTLPYELTTSVLLIRRSTFQFEELRREHQCRDHATIGFVTHPRVRHAIFVMDRDGGITD